LKELARRKPNRLAKYDYSRNGAYFITLCVKDKHELLWQPSNVGATVPGRPCEFPELSEYGMAVKNAVDYYITYDNSFVIDIYVIMPNHIHAVVVITGDRGRSPLQGIVRKLKSFVTKQIGFSIWQKSFHDHIIRDRQDYSRIAEYIKNNPLNWEKDCFYKEREQ